MKVKSILVIIAISIVAGCSSCSSTDANPRWEQEPGIEYCKPACDKMTELYNAGDTACLDYIETIIVDGQEMDCTQFCEYEHNHSIQLHPQCIVEKITSCSEIPFVCEN